MIKIGFPPRARAWVGAALVSACAVAADGQAPADANAANANAANGKRLFLSYGCYACHGTTGASGGIAGPRLAPNPLPLAAVRAKLRSASGRMPVYSAVVMRDDEIADVVAYLQSIPPGLPAADIPLLSRP
jgi:mono/diheme cytochrome c family protein